MNEPHTPSPESDPSPAASSLPFLEGIKAELERVVLGQQAAIEQLLTALVAGGHVLLEGVPGVAKTLLARSLAASFRARFSRIQFTPDLMPADVTGVNIFEPETRRFSFRPGPVFADILLVDEVNRAPAKTQAALLEAMQERQVTLDGETHPLPAVFSVIATQNPIEYEGTYPLPEAQLDRFLMKIAIDYPAEADENAMLQATHRLGRDWEQPSRQVRQVASVEQLLEARGSSHEVEIDDSVFRFVVSIVRQSRAFGSFSLGASPRTSIMLLNAAKALAVIRGQGHLTPDEVREVARPVLRHRVLLTPEAQIEGLTPDQCIDALLRQVAVPR